MSGKIADPGRHGNADCCPDPFSSWTFSFPRSKVTGTETVKCTAFHIAADSTPSSILSLPPYTHPPFSLYTFLFSLLLHSIYSSFMPYRSSSTFYEVYFVRFYISSEIILLKLILNLYTKVRVSIPF